FQAHRRLLFSMAIPPNLVYLSLALSSQPVGKTRRTGTRRRFAPSQSFPGHSSSDAVRPGMRASLQRTPRERSTSEPPKAPHFSWAKDGDVVIQITGIGPSGKTFIKPAN